MSHKDGERLAQARALHASGQHDAATPVYTRLARKYPRSRSVRALLAAAHLDGGRNEQALALLAPLARRAGADADVHYNLGLALAGTGDHQAAADAYRRAVHLAPKHPKAHYNLGVSLRRLGDNAHAVEALLCDHAIAAGADNCRLLARAYTALGERDKAIEYSRRCNGFAQATLRDRRHLVSLLCEAAGEDTIVADADVTALIELAADCLAADPLNPDTVADMARVYATTGQHRQALPLLAQVCAMDPENAEMRMLHGVTQLILGDLRSGWLERTLLTRLSEPVSAAGIPRLTDRPTPGSHVFLRADQGIGDQILYAAMLPELLEAGVAITYACDARLHPLLERSMPELALVQTDAAPSAAHDAFCSIGELHIWLRPDLERVPPARAFLTPPQNLTEKLKHRYASLYPGKEVIALAWRSHNSAASGSKSVPIDALAPVLRRPQTVFVCAQYGDGAAEFLQACEANEAVGHIDSELDLTQDLDAAAAQLAAVHRFVSVSNASVHLAGAVGVETHVLAGKRGIWHWFTEGSQSVWYENVSLHRQQALSSWQDAIAALTSSLR